jgi:2-keto-3-deoxy-L-rhamnonate aldolase RhmA
VGTFVKLGDAQSMDIVASAGFDFAIVDLEHSQLSEGAALPLIHHGFAMGFPVVARIPAVESGTINRMLEAGASGIQLSSVVCVRQVQDLVAATRYPPEGRRSVSLAHPAADYGEVPLQEAVVVPPPLLVGQVETAETDDPLDQILGAGLDVAFVGVTDLTVDLGFDHERVQIRIKEIAEAARAAGVIMGAFAGAPSLIPAGANYVALSSDVALLRAAAAEAISDAP